MEVPDAMGDKFLTLPLLSQPFLSRNLRVLKEYKDMHSRFDVKQFWSTPLGVTFISYIVGMGLVGALTPPDILTAYSWTRPFTDFMASYVSQIDKVTALGIDVDINRFYFSVMWAGSPVLGVMYVIVIVIDRQKKVDRFAFYRQETKKLAKLIFGLIFVAFITYHIEWLTFARSRLVLSSFGSGLGRLVMPQIFVLVPVISCLPAITWLGIALADRISRDLK